MHASALAIIFTMTIYCIVMERTRVAVFEICGGLLLIVTGSILWWWSKQLLWILIYPPPLAKQLIESLPFAFWGVGALLVVDGVRRKIRGSENPKATTVIIVNNYRKPKYRPRIRQLMTALEEAGAQCEVLDYTEIGEVTKRTKSGGIDAVVLSGSSAHLGNPADQLRYEDEIAFIRHVDIPLLGICFGHQLIGVAFGSQVSSLSGFRGEPRRVEILEEDEIFASWNRGDEITLTESHRDYLTEVPEGFSLLAKSNVCEVEAIKHGNRPIYGVQAHVERRTDEKRDGLTVLKNFLSNVAKS